MYMEVTVLSEILKILDKRWDESTGFDARQGFRESLMVRQRL
jgi:hypothetical protein